MRTSLAFLLIGLLSLGGARAGPFDFSNVISSVKDVTTGVAKDVATNLLPTPKGLFETSKQLVAGYPFDRHSLGAHIVGSAGRSFHAKTNKLLPHITGLDPAKPCFNEGEQLGGLQRGNAKFVDVVHSNPGVLGKRDPLGDADFYPGGLDPLPPGCLAVDCAHARAWEYYAETVYPGNEMSFMGTQCGSLTKLREGKCPGKSFPMGFSVPREIKGSYFLEVEREYPFGKFASKGRNLASYECGLCDK